MYNICMCVAVKYSRAISHVLYTIRIVLSKTDGKLPNIILYYVTGSEKRYKFSKKIKIELLSIVIVCAFSYKMIPYLRL